MTTWPTWRPCATACPTSSTWSSWATPTATPCGGRPRASTTCAGPRRSTARSRSIPTVRPSSPTRRGRRRTPRASCTPTARSAARCASCRATRRCATARTSSGAPVGHAIGMLGGLLCPLVGGRPIYMIDGWDPPTVLDAMVEEQISAGSGSTYFFTSLLDCPGYGPEHVELDALRRPGRLAHPQRGGRAGGRARDLAGAVVRLHRASLGHGVAAHRPQGEAHPHRRVPARVGGDAHRRRGGPRRRGRCTGRDPHPRARSLRRLHRPRA